LSGHSDNVTSLIELQDFRIASGSSDKTIKIWNLNNGECELTLSGHSNFASKLIALQDGRIASVSYDEATLGNNLRTKQVKIRTK
jgi:WD40 repeat protein